MLIGSLQFPTRLTVIATICMVTVVCAAGSYLIKHGENRKIAVGIMTGLAAVSTVFGMYQLNDVLYSRGGAIRLYSVQNLGSGGVQGAEYLPMGSSLKHMTYHAPVVSPETKISGYTKENLEAAAYVETGSTAGEQYVELPMLYYKGYHAKAADTGEALQVVKGSNADVRVLLPENFAGEIKCSYDGMWYWHAATAVSIISCLGIILLQLIRKKKQSRSGL